MKREKINREWATLAVAHSQTSEASLLFHRDGGRPQGSPLRVLQEGFCTKSFIYP